MKTANKVSQREQTVITIPKFIYHILPKKFRRSNLLAVTLNLLNKFPSKKTFIQLGVSHNFAETPIYKMINSHMWDGLVVESNPYILSNLQDYHMNMLSGMTFRNQIIGEGSDSVLYWCKEDAGMGTTDHVTAKNSARRRGLDLHETRITMTPFDNLLAENKKYNNPELLFINTVGWDCRIILDINFYDFHPSVIVYQTGNTSSALHKQAWNHLVESGYSCFCSDDNVVAIRPNVLYPELKELLKSTPKR